MAGYYKKQGKTLLNILEDIYKEHGFYSEKLISIVLEGIEGSQRILRIMEEFRKEPIKEISDMKSINTIDYLLDETGNPKSNVLEYHLNDGSWYTIRPSGTEPKIKLYIYTKDKDKDISLDKVKKIENSVINRINKIGWIKGIDVLKF